MKKRPLWADSPLNQRVVTMRLKRAELCQLLIGLNALDIVAADDTTKWGDLRGKLKTILDEFDSQQED